MLAAAVSFAQAAFLQVGGTWIGKSIKKKRKEHKKEVHKKWEEDVAPGTLDTHVQQDLPFAKMEHKPRNPMNCIKNTPKLTDLHKIFLLHCGYYTSLLVNL